MVTRLRRLNKDSFSCSYCETTFARNLYLFFSIHVVYLRQSKMFSRSQGGLFDFFLRPYSAQRPQRGVLFLSQTSLESSDVCGWRRRVFLCLTNSTVAVQQLLHPCGRCQEARTAYRRHANPSGLHENKRTSSTTVTNASVLHLDGIKKKRRLRETAIQRCNSEELG